MTLDPIIVDAKIPEIINRKYFSLQEQLFWLFARKITATIIDAESYSVHVNADNEFPETRYDFTRTLSDYIADDVDEKFGNLKVELNRYLVTLKSSASKNLFIDLVLNQLQWVEQQVEQIEAPEKYLVIIKKRFSQNIQELKSTHISSKYDVKEKKKTWNIQYLRNFEEDEGRFEDFYKRLKDEGLVETNLTYFKQFFNDKEPSKKIKWAGIKAQLVTFIIELRIKNCIKTYREWSAFSKCFEADFSMNKLSSDTPLTNKDEINKIKDILAELDI
ncbi:hypothetical protein DET49_102202 [Salegentibacter sp. 24]|uniref:hypothetical protein n=1 Tax=Salegentibacter sp. 24 TaxID=2183986 RepID=UPI00105F2FDF|nr:hypothetical protein [Salegentibacter sp. 24]TDN95316.1 hypothetical protein DET49_102202 [Salegentibacter sp. 24]